MVLSLIYLTAKVNLFGNLFCELVSSLVWPSKVNAHLWSRLFRVGSADWSAQNMHSDSHHEKNIQSPQVHQCVESLLTNGNCSHLLFHVSLHSVDSRLLCIYSLSSLLPSLWFYPLVVGDELDLPANFPSKNKTLQTPIRGKIRAKVHYGP